MSTAEPSHVALRRRARFAIAVVMTSALAGGFAVVVRAIVERATELLFGDSDVLVAFRGLPAWARLVSPAIGAFVGGLVAVAAAKWLPASHGVGDVMETVVLGRGTSDARYELLDPLDDGDNDALTLRAVASPNVTTLDSVIVGGHLVSAAVTVFALE